MSVANQRIFAQSHMEFDPNNRKTEECDMEITANPTKEPMESLKTLIVEVSQAKINPSSLHDSADLFRDCGLDSASVIDLILNIEKRFDVSIDEDELDVSLFQDLSKLCSLIEAKKRGADPV
jgi:acyl carrier protein